MTRQRGTVGRVSGFFPDSRADRESEPKLRLSSEIADRRCHERSDDGDLPKVVDGKAFPQRRAVFLGNFAFPVVVFLPSDGSSVVLGVQNVECVHDAPEDVMLMTIDLVNIAYVTRLVTGNRKSSFHLQPCKRCRRRFFQSLHRVTGLGRLSGLRQKTSK